MKPQGERLLDCTNMTGACQHCQDDNLEASHRVIVVAFFASWFTIYSYFWSISMPLLRVSVLVPNPLIEAGEKLAVAFRGRLETLRLTAPVKPFSAPTVTV